MIADPQPRRTGEPGRESFKALFTQLAQDATKLVQQELALAKLEIWETALVLILDGGHVAVGIALGLFGGLALTAFLVLFIGDVLLRDNYWLSALIVGTVFVTIGSLLARRAIARVRARRVLPRDSVKAWQDHARWVSKEVKDLADQREPIVPR